MGKLAQQLGGQSQVKCFKNGGHVKSGNDLTFTNELKAFEKRGKDTDPKGKGKEGSKTEESYDRKQLMKLKNGGKCK